MKSFNFKDIRSNLRKKTRCLHLYFQVIDPKRAWPKCDALSRMLCQILPQFFLGKKLSLDFSYTFNYVVNELLENAVKFNDFGIIRVKILFNKKKIYIKVCNGAFESRVRSFEKTLASFKTELLEEVYLETLEKNANNKKCSGIGLLSILHDYEIPLTWEIVPEGTENRFYVSTIALMEI